MNVDHQRGVVLIDQRRALDEEILRGARWTRLETPQLIRVTAALVAMEIEECAAGVKRRENVLFEEVASEVRVETRLGDIAYKVKATVRAPDTIRASTTRILDFKLDTIRIALHLATRADSRAVLDHPGAEDLGIPGTMLYVGPDTGAPMHLRAPYVSHGDTDRLVRLLAQRAHESRPELTIREPSPAPRDWFGSANTNADTLFYEAATVVIQNDAGSTAALQRRLKIGYGRAARILDQLHQAGVVGPPNNSGPRVVQMSLDELKRRSGTR